MDDIGRGGVTIERQGRQRGGRRFGDLADRFARAFASGGRVQRSDVPQPDPQPPAWDEGELPPDDVIPCFPIVRQGYDCAAVDQQLAELEEELAELDRELVELRASAVPRNQVAAELQRIGDQTSEILVAAHDQAEQIKRAAHEQADRWTADAKARAADLTADADRRLREMLDQRASLRQDHARLVAEMLRLSQSLRSVAEGAVERFPLDPSPSKPGSSHAPGEPVEAPISNPVDSGGPDGITIRDDTY